MANIQECKNVGIDPILVEKIEKRIIKLLNDMEKYNLNLFYGNLATLRAIDWGNSKQKIIGHFLKHDANGECVITYNTTRNKD